MIRGGGDLATGVGWRLHRAGFPIVVTELPRPLAVRRSVSFAEAVYAGEVEVEGLRARLVATASAALRTVADENVPVLPDAEGSAIRDIRPLVLVDARMAKRNLGTRIDDAPLVIGLGPGFLAGVDCHAVVETCRGHHLGRALWRGSAAADTGQPEAVDGHAAERVLRAPRSGVITAHHAIGDAVAEGDTVADVGGEPIRAPFGGVLRGIVHDGLEVEAGVKVGDIDPRGIRHHCFEISDKALAIGGGVSEAVLTWLSGRE